MAVPVEKALSAAVGPIARRLWQDMMKVPPGAGLARGPMRLDRRVPFAPSRKELQEPEIERLATKLGRRLSEFRQIEYPSVSDGDFAAAVSAAGAAFARVAPLDIDMIFDVDIDPDRLTDRVAADGANRDHRRRMGEAEGKVYDLVLRQIAVHIVEFFTSRPEFLLRAQVEQIRRAGRQQDLLHAMAATPTTSRDDYVRFEQQYGEAVSRRMNRIRIYGFATDRFHEQLGREHALDTAYVPLRMAPADRSIDVDAPVPVRGRLVGEVFATHPRLLVTGSAGSGKTTALQWLALAAVGALDSPAELQRGLVPFHLSLRRVSATAHFPRPEDFLTDIAPMLAGDMPRGWVHDCLRTGRAVVLVDGIDEVPRDRRAEALEWVRQLVEQWDRARYVITSRPAALEAAWQQLEDFVSYELLPLSPAEAATLLVRWRETVPLDEWMASAVDRLVEQLPLDSRLATLMRNPALCALAARVSADRFTFPSSVLELCKASIDMLVETRDVARGLDVVEGSFLHYEDRIFVLGRLAWWMTRNDVDSLGLDELVDRVRDIAVTVSAGPADIRRFAEPADVRHARGIVQYLLVRSGVITTTGRDEVEFTIDVLRHYLSAVGALDSGDERLLVKYAEEGAWDEVVVFAIAVQLSRERRSSLAEALVDRAESRPDVAQDILRLVGAGIAEAPTVKEIHQILHRLLPVRGVEQAGDLAACGPALLPLLADHDARLESTAAGIVRTAALIGGPNALTVIERFRDDSRPGVVAELLGGWSRFPLETYAQQILAGTAVEEVAVSIDDKTYLGSLTHLHRLRRLRCVKAFDDASVVGAFFGRLKQLTFEGCHMLRDLGPLRGAGLDRLVIRDCPADLSTLDASATAELRLVFATFGPALRTLDPRVNLTHLELAPTAGRLDLTTLEPHHGLRRLVTVGWPSGTEFAVLAGLPDLRELHIAAAVIDDFSPLQELTQLQELHISFYAAPANAEALSRLASLSRLQLDYLGFGEMPFTAPVTAPRP
ncbi:ATP-binding protein [Actinoplanes capillaceus]|uniref:ATP-binding protein n=1 Tax=Actinoplanes campanulatus TaxID=113559 RepID=A0ABQ3WK57_9ACTN|nr:NACHT domain-containing protein [Actinoplanes capillaceus]GID46630.1 ATP-binding protein [Actinoplanes capillaceus]